MDLLLCRRSQWSATSKIAIKSLLHVPVTVLKTEHYTFCFGDVISNWISFNHVQLQQKKMDGWTGGTCIKVQCVCTCILLLLLSPLLQINSPDFCLHPQNLTSVCRLFRFNSILSDENWASVGHSHILHCHKCAYHGLHRPGPAFRIKPTQKVK